MATLTSFSSSCCAVLANTLGAGNKGSKVLMVLRIGLGCSYALWPNPRPCPLQWIVYETGMIDIYNKWLSPCYYSRTWRRPGPSLIVTSTCRTLVSTQRHRTQSPQRVDGWAHCSQTRHGHSVWECSCTHVHCEHKRGLLRRSAGTRW